MHGTVTRATAPEQRSKDREARRQVPRAMVTPGRVLFLAVALIIAAWGLAHNPWVRNRRLAAMSLGELEKAAGPRTEDADLLYYLGLRYDERGEFGSAAPVLKRAAELSPDQARIREEWMRALLGTGDAADAYAELKQFADFYPQRASAHRMLGQFLVTQHSMRKAHDELSQAVKLDATDRVAWLLLAAARDDVADPQGAIQAEERAIALDRTHSGDHLYLGTLYERSQRAQDALREFQAAVRLDPKSGAAHREVAQWHLAHGGPAGLSGAEKEARLAVALDARDALAQRTLGDTLVRENNAPAAVTPLAEAARLDPGDPAPALSLWQVERSQGDRSQADRWRREYLSRASYGNRVRELTESIEMHPQVVATHVKLADLLARHGDIDGCVQQYAAAMHASIDSPRVLSAAAEALRAGGHAAAAEALDRRNLSLHPAEQAYRDALRIELTTVGPNRVTLQVEALAERAAALEPSDPTYLGYLLHVQVARHTNERAMETARKLLAVSPSDAQAHVMLGILLLSKAGTREDLDSAEKELRAVAPPTQAIAATQHYGLGLLAWRRHDPVAAVGEFKRALTLDPEADLTYYHLALAETAAGDRAAGARYMSQYRARQEFKRTEADLLGDIAQHPDQPARYERAIAFLYQHGLSGQAEAVRRSEEEHASAMAAKGGSRER